MEGPFCPSETGQGLPRFSGADGDPRCSSAQGRRDPAGCDTELGITSSPPGRSCWVAVYLCAQGCLLGVLEAMK